LLDAAGDAEAAIETQMEAMLLHPSDFWLNLSFGSLVAQEELTGRLHGTTAIWATRAALVLRPESRAARFGALVHVKDDDASEALLLELRREDPDDPLTEAMHFMAVMGAGRFDEARAMLPDALPALQSLRLDWDYAPFLVALGLGERLFETPGVPPVKLGLLHLVLGRPDEAWPILSAHRDELRPGWPWLYLPTVLRDARSADDLRATMERLSSLPAADEATLRETPTDELLAATDLCHPVDCVRLFQQAFENDPASKERWHLATARQIAAFTAAGASGMAVDEQSSDDRGASRPAEPEARDGRERLALAQPDDVLRLAGADPRACLPRRDDARAGARVPAALGAHRGPRGDARRPGDGVGVSTATSPRSPPSRSRRTRSPRCAGSSCCPA